MCPEWLKCAFACIALARVRFPRDSTNCFYKASYALVAFPQDINLKWHYSHANCNTQQVKTKTKKINVWFLQNKWQKTNVFILVEIRWVWCLECVGFVPTRMPMNRGTMNWTNSVAWTRKWPLRCQEERNRTPDWGRIRCRGSEAASTFGNLWRCFEIS